MLLISKTYEIITPESAEYGEAEEIGFVFENEAFGFREVVDYLKHCTPSQYPITNLENVWFTTHGDTDYKTGNVTQECFHYSRENPTKTSSIGRLLSLLQGMKWTREHKSMKTETLFYRDEGVRRELRGVQTYRGQERPFLAVE